MAFERPLSNNGSNINDRGGRASILEETVNVQLDAITQVFTYKFIFKKIKKV